MQSAVPDVPESQEDTGLSTPAQEVQVKEEVERPHQEASLLLEGQEGEAFGTQPQEVPLSE